MYQKSLLPTSQWKRKLRFPSTKFMGSKRKLIPFIFGILDKLEYESVLDAFSGSGCVAFEFKRRGKAVTTNDFLNFSYLKSKALIENSSFRIGKETLTELTRLRDDAPSIVRDTYSDIFFTYEECFLLDSLWINIQEQLENPYRKALAIGAVCRACQKKRPRGIFTFTGKKSWDGRRDLKMSMQQQFEKAVEEFINAIFDNGKQNTAKCGDLMSLEDTDFDLVYLDPPYWSPLSDNDYVRRYHFIEGYSLYWKDLTIDKNTQVRKFKSYESPFSDLQTSKDALMKLFERYSSSIIALSYSSNGLPTKNELYSMLSSVKNIVEVYEEKHRYSFGNPGNKIGKVKNNVQEYLLIGK
jgi:DNA adenine methylase